MTAEIRVLVVDDHALVRGAIAEQLQAEPDLNIVGAARDGAEAIVMAKEFRPDVVVMDIDMPGMVGFEAARRVQEAQPAARVVFLSAFVQDRYVEEALAAKAAGYVTKREPISTLVKAIRDVAGGGAFFSAEVQSRLVIGGDGVTLPSHARSRLSTLTPREREILKYIAQGWPKKQIADTMSLSVKTVDRHAENLMNKLEIHDRVELARFAIREGIADA